MQPNKLTDSIVEFYKQDIWQEEIYQPSIQQISPSIHEAEQPKYRSPTHCNISATQSRNSLAQSQVGSSSLSSSYINNSNNNNIIVYNWTTHVQLVVKTEEKRACIRLLLAQNQNYFHSCIIYVNSQYQANQVLTNLPQQFNNKAKAILHLKQASKYCTQLQKQQLKILIVVFSPMNQELSSYSIPNCVDFIINSNLPPIKSDLEHRVRKSVGQIEQKLFKGVVVNFCSSNYQKQQMDKFLKSEKITQMQQSTQKKYNFYEYFVQIQSKQKHQQLNKAQSSIQFDYKAGRQKQQQKQQQFDLSWATHIQIAVLENNKNEVTAKIIKNNYDNFNSFIVYAKDYNSAAVARESLPSKIKQKVALITSTLNLQQNFKKFINNETRILFMINDVAKRYLRLSTISIVNKADCIINMFQVADAQQLRLKAGKKIKQMQKIQKGVVVNFINTSVNQQKNAAQREKIQNIYKVCNLKNNIIEIKSDQDYNLNNYIFLKQQPQKQPQNITTNINFNTNNQSLCLGEQQQILIQDKIEDVSIITYTDEKVEQNTNNKQNNIQQIQVQTINKVVNCYDWATYLLVQCQQQFRIGRIANFINKNYDILNGCIVFVKNYDRSKAIVERLDQNIRNKISTLSITQSKLNEYINQLKQGDLKVLILIVNTQSKQPLFTIPNNVDLVIFDSIPANVQQIEQKTVKIIQNQDTYLKGVVVIMHYHGITEVTEFDKFVVKHNIRTKKNLSARQYSLAPYLKQEANINRFCCELDQIPIKKYSYKKSQQIESNAKQDDNLQQARQTQKVQQIINEPFRKLQKEQSKMTRKESHIQTTDNQAAMLNESPNKSTPVLDAHLLTVVNSSIAKHGSLKAQQIELRKYLARLQQSVKDLSDQTNKCVSEGAQCTYTKIVDNLNKESKLNPILENISININKLISKIDRYFKQKQDLVVLVNKNSTIIDDLTDKNKKLKTDISKWTKDYNDLKTQSDAAEVQHQRKYTTLKTNSQKQVKELKQAVSMRQKDASSLKQQVINLQRKYEGQTQQLKKFQQQQRNSIKKMETDHKSQMEELKRCHAQTMKTEIEKLNAEADEQLEKVVEDMTRRHKTQIQKLQEQFQAQKKNITDTIIKMLIQGQNQ